ncbi:MAG: hypothetical protein U0X73_08920 [Thermoanaerobaculia bacterium]
MNRPSQVLSILIAALAFLGCQQNTDKVDSGGVRLSISDFDGLPVRINTVDPLTGQLTTIAQIGTITVQSIILDPSSPTSDLMTVEIRSYEVTFTRSDTGTRTPPKLVEADFGNVSPGGTFTLNNGVFMRADQFLNPPLSDLANFGRDTETGSEVVKLTVGIRFFGKTLSGKEVDSTPGYFTLEIVP